LIRVLNADEVDDIRSNIVIQIQNETTLNNKQISTLSNEEELNSNVVIIPSEEDLLKLKNDYNGISTRLSEIEKLKIEIIEAYDDVCNAPVCSIANMHFNSLSESYDEYLQKVSKIKEELSLYKDTYNTYLGMISKIPKYLCLYQEQYDSFVDSYKTDYENVLELQQKFNKDHEKLALVFIDAQKIADDFFEEYYDLMCHIVNAEAGLLICTSMERCYVANVIENRIKSEDFPDTLYEVVYQFGQYAPTTNGLIDNEPSEMVKHDVEEYLRGRIDTQMPDYVVFQARSPKAPNIWKYIEASGHYFCYN